MKFTLVTTTCNRESEFKRMIESLSGVNSQYLKKIIVIDQSDEHIFRKNEVVLNGLSIDVVHKAVDRTSLSNARNQALAFVDDTSGLLCFPDDDCWYSENFFEIMAKLFKDNNFDIVQTYYREPQLEGRIPPAALIDKRNARYLHPCSVGIFINLMSVPSPEIYFDEKLGVGASLPGGEESDLLFRLLRHGYSIKQIISPYVYHKVMRERLVKPSYKIHAARFYVMLKNKELVDIKKRLIFSFLKSITTVFWDHRNIIGKMYALKLWFLNKK
ncbi:glycosyltransferase family 2 protein [Acinetobacter haemolyticus]|uniref:Glycosyltransferase n=1 Tax=Acinetobacter haemolyticus TaxID=29430 RepID=A0A857IPR0_ACIHA|nr:glycosyltransferase [Acinetobacter haemolyticus]QHI11602.1 glycosyltransferase [Acinetobacter haemolyticus]QHI14869.1 glycosyltransferase [Acinetobacter haemolyticus]